VASSAQPEQGRPRAAPASARVSSLAGWWLRGLLVALALVAATGAVTALGDTLFPVAARGSTQADPNHFLVQLRAVHPILAIAVVFGSMKLAKYLFIRSAPRTGQRRWSLALALLSIAQFGVGLINIWLHAPGWLQLTHLLMAQLMWISAVLLTRAVASEHTPVLAAALEPQPS
jgi:heme A synthase